MEIAQSYVLMVLAPKPNKAVIWLTDVQSISHKDVLPVSVLTLTSLLVVSLNAQFPLQLNVLTDCVSNPTQTVKSHYHNKITLVSLILLTFFLVTSYLVPMEDVSSLQTNVDHYILV